MARNYSNIALDTTLAATVGAGDASMAVASASGWPAAPFAAVIDPGLVTEEVVEVTAKVGTTFTITRGFDGTTAAAHALAAVVRHAAIAGDFTDLQAADSAEAATRAADDATISGNLSSHIGDTSNPHSTTAAQVGAYTSGAVDTLLAAKVPTTRQLTINGTAQDLSADRSYTIPSVSDGDKGDITVSGSGATWTIDNDAVTYAKLQNVSTTSRILGRVTSGAGDVEELTGAQALSITGAQQALSTERSVFSGFNIPGVDIQAISSGGIVVNRTFYEFFEIRTACTLTDLALEITSAAVAASVTRMGIFAADYTGAIGARLLDAGTVAADSLGKKAITGLSLALTPGIYAKAHNSSGAPSYRLHRGGNRLNGIDDGLGANSMLRQRFVSETIAAFPTPGTAPTSTTLGNTSMDHVIVMKTQ